MSAVRIRLATADDADMVAAMLAQLAADIGDSEVFRSTADTVRQYGPGGVGLFQADVAVQSGQPVGLALFFPHFSTTRAAPGVYVQDLWVDATMRGSGLGERLLASVGAYAAQAWGAEYLALTVYHSNPAARRFYDRLGFEAHEDDQPVALTGAAFMALTAREQARHDPD
jgi:GNAT superfamily N-acetyltransferase